MRDLSKKLRGMDGLGLGRPEVGVNPKLFLCFEMHPKIIDVHPKLIPKKGVVQFCHPIAIWLILTNMILPIFFLQNLLAFWPMLTIENTTAMCHLLWRISILRQCLMCLSTTQAHPDKERNGDIVKSFLSPTLGTVT